MKAWISFVLALTFCSTVSANNPTLLVLGDSLSAAYGIDPQHGWVALLQKRLDQENHDYQVINASISGETTSGGMSRLPALLQRYQPRVVIIALGANDGLRGLSNKQMHTNLSDMIEQTKIRGAAVLLVGMQLPPNYGPAYTQLFNDTFKQLATIKSVALVPFLLNDIGEDKSLFQADGLHPTAKAQGKILNNIWPNLKLLL